MRAAHDKAARQPPARPNCKAAANASILGEAAGRYDCAKSIFLASPRRGTPGEIDASMLGAKHDCSLQLAGTAQVRLSVGSAFGPEPMGHSTLRGFGNDPELLSTYPFWWILGDHRST